MLNDNRYGAIKYLQETMFAGRWSEADLANPDFPAMARAFGAEGHLVKQVDDLPRALDKRARPSGSHRAGGAHRDRPAMGVIIGRW